MRVVHGAAADGAGNANIDKGARTRLKHVCKVLCRGNETSVAIDVRLADDIGRGVGDELCLSRIIEESGANISGKSRLAVAPKAAATPVVMRRMPSSICFIVSLLNVRNVPRK
jgi:hypothetical protein